MKRIIRNVGLLLGGVLVAMTLFGCDNLKSPPEERLADELCQKIIDALPKDDADALKKILAPEVLETDDLQVGIEYCMQLYNGTLISFESHGSHYQSVLGVGRSEKIVARYDIETDTENYVLYFNHFMLNKDNQDLEGIYSLKLVTAESEKDESNPGLDSDERKVIGIYNPEWD